MRPILIASLGNPGSAYAHTLHSAGHTLLSSLQRTAGFPPLVKDRKYANGAVSHGHGISLWQSPSYMNDSGPGLATAWRTFCAANTFSSSDADATPYLIILHDELELDLGRGAIKSGAGRSARGHNGLKSFLAMPGMRALDFARIGVGIGPRPASRESAEVASFVLKKMTSAQKSSVEGLAGAVLEVCASTLR